MREISLPLARNLCLPQRVRSLSYYCPTRCCAHAAYVHACVHMYSTIVMWKTQNFRCEMIYSTQDTGPTSQLSGHCSSSVASFRQHLRHAHLFYICRRRARADRCGRFQPSTGRAPDVENPTGKANGSRKTKTKTRANPVPADESTRLP